MPILLVSEQESVANTDVLLKRLVEVMKRFRAEFDETLKALWPRFDYLLRTSKNPRKSVKLSIVVSGLFPKMM
jgi:hypothetical protein